jgi:hypothetical protein
MSTENEMRESDCGTTRELVVWYPTRALDADERRRVEEHAARCAACADLLRFASELEEAAVERYAPHTEPALLVMFAEDPAGLDEASREGVERHLSRCPECRKQVQMLREVEAATASEVPGTFVRSGARRYESASGGMLRRIWDVLGATLFHPVPAAIYMVLALVAVALLVMEPGERAGVYDGRPGVGPGGSAAPALVGGVVILGDDSNRVRGPGDREREEVAIDRNSSHFLLIELTELEEMPSPEDTYTVDFIDEESGNRSFTATVKGESFQDNYTLGVLLEKGSLPVGRYAVSVADPDGRILFRSSFSVR